MELNGSAALVTGAASGLGLATAEHLALCGMTVFGVDLESAVKNADASNVCLLAADVTSEEDVSSVLDTAGADDRPLRLVVNCAGVGWASRILTKDGPHDLDLFRSVVTINLVGTFNVMRLAADRMKSLTPVDELGQRGLVVNTSSAAAFEGQVGQVAYSASKGGVHAMTIAAARDLAQVGIRVNTIAPGIVDTAMLAGIAPDFRRRLEDEVPFPHRLAQPQEYAELVAFLAGHDYMNGETVRMDGALRMAPR